ANRAKDVVDGRQQRFADVKAREPITFEQDNAASRPCEECRRGRSGGSPSADQDVAVVRRRHERHQYATPPTPASEPRIDEERGRARTGGAGANGRRRGNVCAHATRQPEVSVSCARHWLPAASSPSSAVPLLVRWPCTGKALAARCASRSRSRPCA